ncbi:MAG: hypothetical protein JWN72_112, partial [Thermoleophilia bacterium]|nr:hypothetical protein [Thermoleophilia bacterium]
MALAIVIATALLAWGLLLFAGVDHRVRGESKSYGLPSARVDIDLAADGSALVTERITFDFDGRFAGAYRDIPMRRGDDISDVVECGEGSSGDAHATDFGAAADAAPAASGAACPDGSTPYATGGSVALGSSDVPGRFGTTPLPAAGAATGGILRIVWHYDAASEHRDFVLRYRATGWVRRPDDPASGKLILTANPWGSEWKASLGSLDVRVTLPDGAAATAGDIDVWSYARGAAQVRTTREAGVAFGVHAIDVAPNEVVQLLAVLPADAGIAGAGLPVDVRSVADARRDGPRSQEAARARETRWDRIRHHRTEYVALAALGGLLLGSLLAWLYWRRALVESAWPDDVDRTIPDPPGVLEPALAVALVEQRTGAAPTALVATVFDLVRRGVWRTLPAQGTGRGTDVDIALVRGTRPVEQELTPWEQRVVGMVDRIIGDGDEGLATGEFRERIKGDLKLSHAVASAT